jgi:hypothetical protein
MKPMMKFFIGIWCLGLLNSAMAQPIEQCLNEAKDWVYRNTSANASDAAKAALDFCRRGGRSNCLNPSKEWIYRNTSANANDAALKAVKFCGRGDETCLDSTKDWIYRNTTANASQAAEQAIETCSERAVCEPIGK